MQENLPKILVISHTPFSSSDSNGSTLASYFGEYAPDKMAQFYIKNVEPDLPVCKNYYRVTDNEILNKILHPFSANLGGKVELKTDFESTSGFSSKNAYVNKKNRAAGMLLRNILWSTNIWNNKEFKNWIKEFSPDIIMLQPGDFAYIYKIACRLSKKLDIPLVIYQTESHYVMYNPGQNLIRKIYWNNFKRTFEKAMEMSSLCIYLFDDLERAYKKHFTTPSVTIYKSTSIVPEVSKKEFNASDIKFIYGGNIGELVGRSEPLLEMGKAVKELGYYIDVYTASKGEHMSELTEENGIKLHKPVSYSELQEKIKESDFILHMENQKDSYREYIKYAFSTKIADMLASGVCGILYGSREIADINYFAENDTACVVENGDELVTKIRELIENSELRNRYIKNAIELAKVNHNPQENCKKMNEVLKKVYSSYKRG